MFLARDSRKKQSVEGSRPLPGDPCKTLFLGRFSWNSRTNTVHFVSVIASEGHAAVQRKVFGGSSMFLYRDKCRIAALARTLL
jgi:hypothetical protein